MNRSFLLIVLLSSFLFQKSWSQDAEFSQFYAAPLHLNPAMIGFSEAPRFVANVRDQAPSFEHAYITSAVSYDQHFYKYNSSVGVSILGDVAGRGLYNSYLVTGYYAYQLDLTSKIKAKAGFQAGYLQRTIAEDQLVFRDMLDPLTGEVISNTAEAPLTKSSVHLFDVGAGILLYDDSFFAGVSVKHLTTPDVSFTDDISENNRLDMRFSVHLGKTFSKAPKSFGDNPAYITPNLLFVKQGEFQQINGGAYVGKGIFFGGLWFRHTIYNADALIMLLGIKAGIFKIGYSYDFTISQVQTTVGAHEFSLTFDMGQSKYYKNKRKASVECPNMFGY